jgi:ribosomal protein S18 acetylase RimI-like enzyme
MAMEKDIPKISELLLQVCLVHHDGRPDIFKDKGSSKYCEEDLQKILSDEKTPVFVAADSAERVLGYAFCVVKETKNNILLHDRKVLYLDDLCVNSDIRGRGIGRKLMEKVQSHAQEIGANSIELNVWDFNKSAIEFYKHCGFSVLKSTMELDV